MIIERTRTIVTGIGMGLLFLASACAADPIESVAPGEPESTIAPAPMDESQTGELGLPELDSSLKVLAEGAPRQGSADIGGFDVQPGEVWINVNCKGSGDLVVRFEPLDRFTFRCTDELLITKNQLNLVNARSLQVAVTAPNAVEWSLRVQQ